MIRGVCIEYIYPCLGCHIHRCQALVTIYIIEWKEKSSHSSLNISLERTYRPPPPSPLAMSSVMSPTPYQSSYLVNKRVSAYGNQLTVDGNQKLCIFHVLQVEMEPKWPSRTQVAESVKLSRLEWSKQRMQEWEQELKKKPVHKWKLRLMKIFWVSSARKMSLVSQ